METVRIAFVLGALNNLDVCAADVSTAFLYGKTREKVYVIAGKEFGIHAGKRMIVDRSCYGLKQVVQDSMKSYLQNSEAWDLLQVERTMTCG